MLEKGFDRPALELFRVVGVLVVGTWFFSFGFGGHRSNQKENCLGLFLGLSRVRNGLFRSVRTFHDFRGRLLEALGWRRCVV